MHYRPSFYNKANFFSSFVSSKIYTLLLPLLFSYPTQAMEEEASTTILPTPIITSGFERIEQEKEKFSRGDILAAYTLSKIFEEGNAEIERDPYQANVWREKFAEALYQPDREGIWILSIDGGGIRGIIPATILERFEEDLRQSSGLDIYISDFLKMVAGTSTGAIMVLGLTTPHPFDSFSPNYQAAEINTFYINDGQKVFPSNYWFVDLFRKVKQATQPKFSSTELKDALIRHFGEGSFGHTVNQIRALIPSYHLRTNQPYIFDSNIRAHRALPKNQIALASAAAPTYFPAVKIAGEEYVDGGLSLNNPALLAYEHARLADPDQKIHLISLGTGTTRQPLPPYLREGGAIESTQGSFLASLFSLLNRESLSASHLPQIHEGWMFYLPHIMITEATESVHKNLQLIQKLDPNLEYFRLQPEIRHVEMDAVSEMPYLRQKAEEFYATNKRVRELKEKLQSLCLYRAEILDKKLSLLPRLRRLNLSGIRLTSTHLQRLCQGLHEASEVRELNLQRTGLTAEALALICEALVQNKCLTHLDLAENGIRRKGVISLSELLNKNTTLQILNLRKNGIEAEEITLGYLVRQITPQEALSLPAEEEREHFIDYIVPTSLKYLNLSENSIGPRGLQTLTQALKEIEESQNRILLKHLLILDDQWSPQPPQDNTYHERWKLTLAGVAQRLNFNLAI